MKADRQTETVCQSKLVIDHIARVDRIILFARITRDNRPTVGSNRKTYVRRACFHAAFEPAAQMARADGIVVGKTQIIDIG